MGTITIDGRQVEFDDQKMILQVAIENQIEIPHYCYHPGLSVVASCRICLAEVAAPNPRANNQLELMPKLIPTCQTPAADGMVVHTRSPKAIANQKAVMEYLLINHPVDCPVCDQAGECHLQDYSYRYGRGASRFEDDKVKQPKKDIGPHVLLYSDRCIMCSRCVRFTREVTGTSEIGVFGRGHTEQIDIFPGQPLDNALSGNVVDICPVGALLDKDFLFSQRVWFLKQTASIDGITASGDNIWIHHHEGRIYRLKPRENLDVNKWWISDEIRYEWQFVHREDRLRTPLRQQYGAQVECDWARAYEEVRAAFARLIDASGHGCLAVMVSPMLACEDAYLLGKFVRGLDPQATLAIGPVSVDGQNQTFPGGYQIYAEKCPNRRGVQRALGSLGGQVQSFEDFLKQLLDKQNPIGGVVLTGNYPDAWPSSQFIKALSKKFVVLMDTLPNDLSGKADVVLPGATWVEKAGTFENANGRCQSFEAAIPVIEMAKNEGQIALDLMAACGLIEPRIYDAEKVRQEIGQEFAGQVHHPADLGARRSDMEYVEL